MIDRNTGTLNRVYTPKEMRTIAARLRKPHSRYVAETAADVLEQAAERLESHSPATGGGPQKDEIVTQIEQLEWVSHSERDPRRYVDFDKVLTILHNKREDRE